ncbi:MAG TPA: hypothetical protein VIL46_07340 [Gemmataceae bacterium]
MSVPLRTRAFLTEPERYLSQLSFHPLAQEMGWREVASGLGRILAGCLLFVVAAAGAVVVAPLVAAKAQAARNLPGPPDPAVTWLVMLSALGLASLVLLCYWLMISGQWRCALGAPDRCGARWFLFGCILCVLVGPAMSVAEAIIAASDPLAARFTPAQRVGAAVRLPLSLTELVGVAVDLIGMVLFVLFIRSVGVCFDARRLISQAELYLTFSVGLIAMTLYLIFGADPAQLPRYVMLLVGIGWIAGGVWFLFLIAYCRLVIHLRLRWFQAERLAS